MGQIFMITSLVSQPLVKTIQAKQGADAKQNT